MSIFTELKKLRRWNRINCVNYVNISAGVTAFAITLVNRFSDCKKRVGNLTKCPRTLDNLFLVSSISAWGFATCPVGTIVGSGTKFLYCSQLVTVEGKKKRRKIGILKLVPLSKKKIKRCQSLRQKKGTVVIRDTSKYRTKSISITLSGFTPIIIKFIGQGIHNDQIFLRWVLKTTTWWHLF